MSDAHKYDRSSKEGRRYGETHHFTKEREKRDRKNKLARAARKKNR